jgi:hypothetical protein
MRVRLNFFDRHSFRQQLAIEVNVSFGTFRPRVVSGRGAVPFSAAALRA